MAGKDIISMTQQELKRLHIIRKAIEKTITQGEAADIIGVSLRQAQRIARAVRLEGNKGVIHKSRGKFSHRAFSDKLKEKVLKICREKYHNFGPTLASEKLFEREKIKLNDETLRLWFIQKSVYYKNRKKRPHRQWRQRKSSLGEMIQMDGSKHDWFEGRGEPCVLMGYIDDASGTPFAEFHSYEGTIPAICSFKHYVEEYGIPASLYLDKHSTYKINKKRSIEDDLKDMDPLSQFARVVKEIGTHIIYADSPQGKGRIERLFGTFQDRVIKEMRLAEVKTIEEGNRFLKWYLPVYAKRFGVKPAKDANLHRPLPKGIDLDTIFCKKTKRALRNDFTVAHDKKLYQIENNIRAQKVVVEERIDGSMLIRHKNMALRFKEITMRPEKTIQPKPDIFSSKAHTPAANHPWRVRCINPQNSHYERKEKSSQKEKELLLIKT